MCKAGLSQRGQREWKAEKGRITWAVGQLRDKGSNWEMGSWPGHGLEGQESEGVALHSVNETNHPRPAHNQNIINLF